MLAGMDATPLRHTRATLLAKGDYTLEVLTHAERGRYRYVVWKDVTHTRAALESGCTGQARGPVAVIDVQQDGPVLDAEPGVTEEMMLALLLDLASQGRPLSLSARGLLSRLCGMHSLNQAGEHAMTTTTTTTTVASDGSTVTTTVDPTTGQSVTTWTEPTTAAAPARRILTGHHDGLGLNDIITIEADPLDPVNGNASHEYVAYFAHPDGTRSEVARIQFQHGPRNVVGSKPGVTESVLYEILADRLRSFQAGPFSCRENAVQLTHVEEAQMWSERRARLRARRGVLGTNVA